MKPRIYVAEVMEALSVGLRSITQERMASFFKDYWLEQVQVCLPEKWKGVTEKGLADPYVTLRVLSRKWRPVFCPPAEAELRRTVAELIDDRNAWAHFAGFTPREAGLVTERALLLLKGIGSPAVQAVQDLLGEGVREYGGAFSPHGRDLNQIGLGPLSPEPPSLDAWLSEPPHAFDYLEIGLFPRTPETGSFSRSSLEVSGFRGFISGSTLMGQPGHAIPREPGVYVVLRAPQEKPVFLDRSPAGHFKGKDPSVPVAWLEEQWVEGSEVIYIGRTKNLFRRIVREHLRFGQGAPIGAWGGRLIFQLAESADFGSFYRRTTPARSLHG
jgi:hypothetical protein